MNILQTKTQQSTTLLRFLTCEKLYLGWPEAQAENEMIPIKRCHVALVHAFRQYCILYQEKINVVFFYIFDILFLGLDGFLLSFLGPLLASPASGLTRSTHGNPDPTCSK